MGRDPNENGRGTRKKQQPVALSWWSFHPTVAEAEQLRVLSEESDDPWGHLIQIASERMLTLTITRSASGDSMCLVARDKTANFNEGQALSVFHIDPHKLAVAMLYVLDVKYPNWPAQAIGATPRQFDW